MKRKQTVYLVGAGPGEVGLLTLRGAELLAKADVVVYDALVNPDLLRLAPATAEVIYGGKRPRDHAIPQEKLNALLVAKAKEGKVVVRLKGGDPYIFGRGGEEAEELAAAKVPFEVVPGVSSVVAGPSYAGIPLTHRDHCSSFTVITGHEDPGKEGTSLDFKALARTEGTKVVLMGVERIRPLCESLIAHGMKASTPVGMVRWGTTGQQQSLEGTLADIPDQVEKTGFSAPAVTVIGDVVKLRKKLNWFEKRPLFGKRVVVTRARDKAKELSSPFLALGAEVLEIPTIKTLPPDNRQAIVDALLELGTYDWAIFTSPTGVSMFFDYFFKTFDDLRDLGALRFAAVGPGTAAKLKELHLKVDLMPKQFVGSEVAKELSAYQDIENLKILLLRAEVANPELPAALQALGAIVDDVPCYKTVAEVDDLYGAGLRLTEMGADWITFTSQSTVEHFHARFDLPKLVSRFPQLLLASIGPETTKGLTALGLTPAVEASRHTMDGLVEALELFLRRGRRP